MALPFLNRFLPPAPVVDCDLKEKGFKHRQWPVIGQPSQAALLLLCRLSSSD